MSDAVEQALSNGAKIIDFHSIYLKNGCNYSGNNTKVKHTRDASSLAPPYYQYISYQYIPVLAQVTQ